MALTDLHSRAATARNALVIIAVVADLLEEKRCLVLSQVILRD